MYLNIGREQRIATLDTSHNTIILSDNSKWKITGIHSYKITTWLITHKVVVERHGPSYRIKNINKDVTVDAKLLS